MVDLVAASGRFHKINHFTEIYVVADENKLQPDRQA
jgi:hypothetical protein